ncbi:tetratricopeptide repeat protein [Variovorax sp. PCZ-1]|uniref:tetratricopeptide repeat protein n=1 Tax=Variovorax sp. PCZ-1 TaxID=2835533 RepID=UPI001BCC154A|nr:tetratricopeptide repeat protein [Variovorax sp. PCZ-1]MBS7807842.1 tetratricopeptide repeat protein [Variovorax sp. PCZ-1]
MPFNTSSKLVFTALALALSTQAATAQQRTPARPAASTPAATETIANSNMDGELFYQLLLGELNAIPGLGGSAGNSYSFILDAARRTNDASLYQRAVELAISNRAGDPALAAARAWKSAQPQSRDANLQVLQVLLALNRLPETAEPLRTQIQLTPAAERSSAISQIPRLYARVTDKKAAATLVEQALAEFIGNTATASASWTAVGRTRLAAADATGAIDAATRAQAADAKAIGPALLALELMDPKQPNAEPIVRKYLENAEAIPEVRLGYVRALLDAQRSGEASAQVQRLTKDKPDMAEAWALQGSLELQDNKIDNADASFKKYIELATPQRNSEEKQRGLTQAYLSLAQIAEKRKDFSLAESWLAKIDSPQALVSTQNRRASMLAKQGKLAEARELIRKLPERAGADGAADRRQKILSEAQLLRDNKEHQATYDLLAQAVERNPQDHELIYQQASAAEKLKRYGEMERLMRRAIEVKPDYAYAYNALGYSFADRNVRLPEAKTLLQKAIELAPGDPAITDSLGWVEFRMGNLKEAIALLEKAYKAYPNAEIGAHLAEVLWVSGQRDRATAIFKECMLLDKEDEVLVETLKRLRVRL